MVFIFLLFFFYHPDLTSFPVSDDLIEPLPSQAPPPQPTSLTHNGGSWDYIEKDRGLRGGKGHRRSVRIRQKLFSFLEPKGFSPG